MPIQPDQIITCIGSTLAAIPLLLVLVYVSLGRGKRIRQLRSYVRPSAMATEVVETSTAPPKETPAESPGNHVEADVGETLADFFERSFEQAHQLSTYAATLFLFYCVYGVLLYWSFVAWGGLLLADPHNLPIETAVWPIARLGAMGVFGATFGAIWHLHWRVVRLDLQPKTLLQLSARLCVAPFLAIALAKVFPLPDVSASLVAFCAGLFGDDAWRALRQFWRKKVLQYSNNLDASLSLQMIQGISNDDELRLWEEGITDVEHLAFEKTFNILVNTHYSLERIVDWKDQAFLCVYVGDKISSWRAQGTRTALDVMGMAPEYYGKESDDLVGALSKKVDMEPEIIKRLIDTIVNDPQVHQLWSYVKNSYPSEIAERVFPQLRLLPGPVTPTEPANSTLPVVSTVPVQTQTPHD